MLNRVHIQILDNPIHWAMDAKKFSEPVQNRVLTEELKSDMDANYPSVVSVEYIDLFSDGEESFPEIRDLLDQGLISAPIVIINGASLRPSSRPRWKRSSPPAPCTKRGLFPPSLEPVLKIPSFKGRGFLFSRGKPVCI